MNVLFIPNQLFQALSSGGTSVSLPAGILLSFCILSGKTVAIWYATWLEHLAKICNITRRWLSWNHFSCYLPCFCIPLTTLTLKVSPVKCYQQLNFYLMFLSMLSGHFSSICFAISPRLGDVNACSTGMPYFHMRKYGNETYELLLAIFSVRQDIDFKSGPALKSSDRRWTFRRQISCKGPILTVLQNIGAKCHEKIDKSNKPRIEIIWPERISVELLE